MLVTIGTGPTIRRHKSMPNMATEGHRPFAAGDSASSPRNLSDADVFGLNERPASPPDRKKFVTNYASPMFRHYLSVVDHMVNSRDFTP